MQFATGSSGRVGVLVGRGGTGKTKMLHSLCERMRAGAIGVRFLERDPVIDHQAFEQFPAGRLLVVVDDAHDEEAPLGKVVAGCWPPTQTLTFCWRCGLTASSGRAASFARPVWIPSRRQGGSWPICSCAEAEALVRAVLGQQHAYAARRLATATRDCPYLLVTGALHGT